MACFHRAQQKFEHRLCIVCHEIWPTQTALNEDPTQYTCTRCKRDKHDPKLFSSGNDMDPGKLPLCLSGMTQLRKCC